MTEGDDPVRYTIEVEHFQTGDIVVTVRGLASTPANKPAVLEAMRIAMEQIENGVPTDILKFN